MKKVVCPTGKLLEQITGQWTAYILFTLAKNGSMRFGVLKRHIEGISAKVLTDRLRHLESAGFIDREYKPTVPPEVSYSLADKGQQLYDILMQIDVLAQEWYASEDDQDLTIQPPPSTLVSSAP